jgi:HlyD family secretion protein
MAEKNEIFRKVALERLSSPEQLDRLITVTSPKAWLSLAGLGLVILAALVWAIFGQLPKKVTGHGVIVRSGGVFDVVSAGAGVVLEVSVRPEAIIKENDIVAVVDQPDLQLRIRNQELELSELKAQYERNAQAETEALKIDLALSQQQRTNALVSLENYERQINSLRRKLASQTEALQKGLIIESARLATEIELFTAEQQKAQAQQKLTEISGSELSRSMQMDQQRQGRQQRIDDSERALRLLRQQLELTSRVRSPYAGRVLEVAIDEGESIPTGKKVLSVEKVNVDLEAVVYVPAADGKKIRPQMLVQVSPSTVKREEAGFILGTVGVVSAFPATGEGIMRLLHNQELVRQLTSESAPIEVSVTLQKSTNGNFRWSSARHTPSVESGTLCECSIIVENQRPISMILPLLKSYVFD